jgi:hypothetical protein
MSCARRLSSFANLNILLNEVSVIGGAVGKSSYMECHGISSSGRSSGRG